MLAARLLSLGVFVFLAPGLACLARMPGVLEWPEQVVFGFAISYVWIFALSIVLPAAGGTVVHAGLLTAAFVLLVTPWTRLRGVTDSGIGSMRPSMLGLLMTA